MRTLALLALAITGLTASAGSVTVNQNTVLKQNAILIQGKAISPDEPEDGETLVFDEEQGRWEPGEAGVSEEDQLTLNSLDSDPTKVNCIIGAGVDGTGLTVVLIAELEPCLVSLRATDLTDGNINNSSYMDENGFELLIPPTATLGCLDGVECLLYVYVADSSSVVVVAGSYLAESAVYNIVGITTGSDSATVPYGESSDAGEALKLVARIKVTAGTAGDWENAIISEITPWPLFSTADVVAANRQLSNLGITAINADLTFDASLEEAHIKTGDLSPTSLTLSTALVTEGAGGGIKLLGSASGMGGAWGGAVLDINGADESEQTTGSISGEGGGTAETGGDGGNVHWAGGSSDSGTGGHVRLSGGPSGDDSPGNIEIFGHMVFEDAPLNGGPTIDSCGGGSPSVAGTDTLGTITTGTTVTTECSIDFGVGWQNSPVCMVTKTSAGLSIWPTTTSNSLTINTATALGDGATFDYVCFGNR